MRSGNNVMSWRSTCMLNWALTMRDAEVFETWGARHRRRREGGAYVHVRGRVKCCKCNCCTLLVKLMGGDCCQDGEKNKTISSVLDGRTTTPLQAQDAFIKVDRAQSTPLGLLAVSPLVLAFVLLIVFFVSFAYISVCLHLHGLAHSYR